MTARPRSSSDQTIASLRKHLHAVNATPTGGIIVVPPSTLSGASHGSASHAVDGDKVSDQAAWEEAYYAIYKGCGPGGNLISLDDIQRIARGYASSREVPIALAHFRYDTLRDGALSFERDQASDAIVARLRDPATGFEATERFLASAVLPHQFDYFTAVAPSVPAGEPLTVVAPLELQFTNLDAKPASLTIDFHDDRGALPIGPGDRVSVTYREPGAKTITVRADQGGTAVSSTFTVAVDYASAPPPDENWVDLSSTSFDGATATGHAWVYYGSSNGQKHTGLVNPIIISEGFPGDYSLDYLWWSLTSNACDLGNKLLAAGMDLIILGYDDGTTYLEANAGVVQAAVLKAIQERSGDQKLVVGGACMGGVVVRYALASMETNAIDHQTSLYFSIDSPHMGISCSVGVQYALAYASELSSTAYTYYQKLQEPAAQELLLYSEDSIIDGPEVPSSLRTQFLANLEAVGGFPKLCRKIGIADGMDNGSANGLDSGIDILSPGTYALYSAPGSSGENIVFSINYDDLYWNNYWPNCPFSIDGAPGSVESYFQQVSSQMGQSLASGVPGYCCFVPTISALSMSGLNIYDNNDLYMNLTADPVPQSDLDAYLANTSNAPHMQVTEAMVTWLIQQLNVTAQRAPGSAAARAR